MRYRETREQTAELLRMVLPLMTRHAAGFHPLSYAVWYEYAAGTNQALKAAIDSFVAAGTRLNDSDIEELFDRHVATHDIESSMKVRARIQEVVEQVTETTQQASQEVGRYSEGLSEYQQRLQRNTDNEALAELVVGLLGDTRRVRERTSDLHQHLEANTREARRLQDELETAQGKTRQDPLTELLNRRGLDHLVRERYPGGLPSGALLRIDVDQLGDIVTSFGHLLADRVLASVGRIISASAAAAAGTAAAETVTARTGGESFLVFQPGGRSTEMSELAEAIRSGVERCRIRRQDSDEGEGGGTSVSVSIGAVLLPGDETLAAAIARADQALARSKQEGGNRITVRGAAA